MVAIVKLQKYKPLHLLKVTKIRRSSSMQLYSDNLDTLIIDLLIGMNRIIRSGDCYCH
jgi:hypothetical protein